jgi:hypothetical protein
MEEGREIGCDVDEERREDREMGERSNIGMGRRRVRGREEGSELEGRDRKKYGKGEPSHFPNHSGRCLCFNSRF